MTRRDHTDFDLRWAAIKIAPVCLLIGAALCSVAAQASNYPITNQQRGTAQKVSQEGVALSELARNAPDSYTVKRNDTLWDISKLFLKSPWRWPELWGMNLDQIRNPHLIYPGQILYLDKSNGRARLRVGQPVGGGTTKLSPRIRTTGLGDNTALPSIAFNLIEPFLNEAVIFQSNELEMAPRVVATQENRVLVGKNETAYVLGGDMSTAREYRIFREPKKLLDPTTQELLGYEAAYLASAEYVRAGETRVGADGKSEVVPGTIKLTAARQEVTIGDRLAVVPQREYTNYAPHAPQGPMDGRIVSIYGDGLTAGQNQIVALNRGVVDGMERGHVLSLIRNGDKVVDKTDPSRPIIKLPDERHGVLFVFRVFDRMSYALILTVQDPVKAGDYFSKP
jgi:LysM domain